MARWQQIIHHFEKGGLLLYPTETLWGLGADPHNLASVKQIFELKDRCLQSPLSLLVKNVKMAHRYVKIDSDLDLVLKKMWPRPVTFVLPAQDEQLATSLGAADGTIGVRVSQHPWVKEFFSHWSKGALISTSANVSGQAYSVEFLKQMISKHVLCVKTISENDKKTKRQCKSAPSTVLAYSKGRFQQLREGDVSLSEVQSLFFKK